MSRPRARHFKQPGRWIEGDDVARAVGVERQIETGADADFQNKALELGPPPKVIRIERCDFSTREIAALMRRETIRITEFMSSSQPLLVLRR